MKNYKNKSIKKPINNQGMYNLNDAIKLHRSGKIQEARKIYERILTIDPNHFDAIQLLATIELQEKNIDKALELFDRALMINNKVAPIHNNKGLALQKKNMMSEAVMSFDKAIYLNPNSSDAYNNKGIALKNLGKFEEAMESFDTAIRINKSHSEAYANKANILLDSKKYTEAIENYEKAISINKTYAEAYYNLGNAYAEIKSYDKAIGSYDSAIKLRPEFSDAYLNRGTWLRAMNRLDEALDSYCKAIKYSPNNSMAYSNLGSLLFELGRIEESIQCCDAALKINPNNHDAKYNKASCMLRKKSFLEGFELYRSRWFTKLFNNSYQKTFPIKVWDGNVNIKKILIWGEQGVGDEIFYSRMITTLERTELHITLVADKRLHPVFLRSFPRISIIDRYRDTNKINCEEYDAQTSIGELAYFGKLTEEKIHKQKIPFLVANKTLVNEIKSKYKFGEQGVVCGLSWGSKNIEWGGNKSINLNNFLPILETEGFHFVNLQYGDVTSEINEINLKTAAKICQINNVDLYADLEGLFSIVDACDLVITTSNITAHVAGSLGKKTILFVPHSKGRIWYWHDNDEYSLWYPSIRIFYQSNPQNWANEIESARNWLKENL